MLKKKIKVIPRAKKNQVITTEDGLLKVYVTSPATEGKANKAVLKLLSKHFGVSPSSIQIIKGEKSRNKVVEIFGAER